MGGETEPRNAAVGPELGRVRSPGVQRGEPRFSSYTHHNGMALFWQLRTKWDLSSNVWLCFSVCHFAAGEKKELHLHIYAPVTHGSGNGKKSRTD